MRRSAMAVLLVVLVAGPAPAPAATAQDPLVPPPSYYRPVIVDGMTFPVARANWLSVIRFDQDWHAPRFRRVGGSWELVGIHEGNDIMAEKGTPVLSMTPGTVEAVGWTFYSGTRVGVRGTDGKYYFYAHLSRVAPGIRAGAPVETGSVLGLVGSTGYGPPGEDDRFPPHLHLGIRGSGGWENPFPLVRMLYRRSVAATTEGERRLAELAREGRRGAWAQEAERLYADLAVE